MVDSGSSVLGGRTGSLCLLRDGGRTLELVRQVGLGREVEAAWHRFPFDAATPAGDAIRTEQPLVISSVPNRDRLYPPMAGTPTADQAWVTLPLIADAGPLGSFTIGFRDPQEFSAEELTFLASLGDLCAQAIQRALLFEERSEVATTLQATLLPPTLPEIPGGSLGAVYVAAGGGGQVGGDFYDAFVVDEGRWFLTIGDVRGKGIEAAAVTSLARHTIRSGAVTDPDPVAVLRHLNEMLLRSHEDGDAEPRFCTVAAALLERTTGGGFRLTSCAGGHPLPLRWAGGRGEEVGRPGTVLGVLPDVELVATTTELAPGDILVFYTDGVSERREGLRFFEANGVLDVLGTVGEGPAADVAAAVEAAVRTHAPAAPADDLAVLVLRVDESGPTAR